MRGRAPEPPAGDEGRSGEGGPPSGDDFSLSFRLTLAFLDRHPRYRERLSLTPENARFDPVLWRSSLAALDGLLRAVAEDEGLPVADQDVREAVRNLVEGVVLRARRWEAGP